MIVSTGIDIVDIDRVERAFEQCGSRFRDRVFTPAEIAYCEEVGSKISSYAARFAAKEAVMKALGTGWSEGIGWKDIEVVRDSRGKPDIRLSGKARERFDQMGATRLYLSQTHSRNLAIAQVIFES